MKHPITSTQNGTAVYVDLIKSPAALHIAQQPYLLGLIKELIRHRQVDGETLSIDHDMGRPVGNALVVETSDKDVVIYAQRVREDMYTRFVKNGSPKQSPYVSVILRRDDDGEYELHDTWIGRLTPPRPGSGQETDDSLSYWQSHAYVYNHDAIQARTVTKVCPY